MDTEDSVIATVLAAVPHLPSPVGPGDDAALLDPGHARVVTTDLLIEDTHFLLQHPPEALGWKSLMVNLSDVAAMGAVPTGFTLGLGLPATWNDDRRTPWLEAFAAGLGAAARAAGIVISGGDTVRSERGITIAITAWGRLAADTSACLRRDAIQPGDILLVRGHIGRSGLGLRRWLGNPIAPQMISDDPCLTAHLRPEPPLADGPWALAHGAHAAMDLSDGLALDLPRLARASRVAITIDLAHLPPDPAQTARPGDSPWTPLDRARAGEDYALLVAVPPSRVALFETRGFHPIATALQPTSPHPAGHVAWFLDGHPIPPPSASFHHFPGPSA